MDIGPWQSNKQTVVLETTGTDLTYFEEGLGPLVCCLLLCQEDHLCLGLTYSDIKETLDKGIGNYSTAIRPLLNQSEHVKVSISWYLMKITAVKESEQTLQATSFLTISWHDQIMEQALRPLCNNGDPCQTLFSETHYYDIEQNEFQLSANMLWLPDLRIHNAQGKFALDAHETTLTLFNNGDVIWVPGGQFKTSCNMDVRKFPFDSHKCHMDIGPFQSHKQTVVPESTGADLMFFEKDGEWQIINKHTSNVSHIIGGCCRYTIIIQRRPEMLVTTMILPTTLLSFIGTLVFKLPTESGERISLSVSVTLALILYLTIIQTSLPRSVTKPSYFEILLCAEVVLNLINVFMTVVNIMIYHKGTWKLKHDSLLMLLMTRRCPLQIHTNEAQVDMDRLGSQNVAEEANDKIPVTANNNPNIDERKTNGYHDVPTAPVSRFLDTISFVVALLANVIVLMIFVVMVIL